MSRINLDSPHYDQNSFIGRLKHFAEITDWRLCFKNTEELIKARDLLAKYREGSEPPETKREDVFYAKRLYASSFHPDTGEKQNLFGRMCFQVPGGMVITGAMMTFYKTNSAVIFWQWVNQSFNALVNYTNRNANSPLTTKQMGVAYVSATSAALVTALGLKSVLSKKSSLFQRFVPFGAVAAANIANIPLMRQNELLYGIPVHDENGNVAVSSKVAAVKGISQVVFSRIMMAMPGMTVLPFLMESLEKFKFIRNPLVNVVFQISAVGAILTVMTPTSCAIFNQRCSISSAALKKMEPTVYEELNKIYSGNVPEVFYFNKGL